MQVMEWSNLLMALCVAIPLAGAMGIRGLRLDRGSRLRLACRLALPSAVLGAIVMAGIAGLTLLGSMALACGMTCSPMPSGWDRALGAAIALGVVFGAGLGFFVGWLAALTGTWLVTAFRMPDGSGDTPS